MNICKFTGSSFCWCQRHWKVVAYWRWCRICGVKRTRKFLICQKLKSRQRKILCTNSYRKNARWKLVVKTFFWQNIFCTPKNVPALSPMPAGSLTVMVCGNVAWSQIKVMKSLLNVFQIAKNLLKTERDSLCGCPRVQYMLNNTIIKYSDEVFIKSFSKCTRFVIT